MKKYFCIFASALLLGLTSCDDGRLYEEAVPVAPEGRTVTLTARLTGISSWPQSSFYVAMAGFDGSSEYAVISKTVPAPTQEGGEVTVELSGIKEEVKQVELCVINRLRKRIVSYYVIEESELTAANEIKKDAGTLNVGMYSTIQDRVFNTTCVNCHGAATSAAAGLYLTGDRSYAAMVGQPSTKVEGRNIVEPYKADESVLYQALSTDISQTENWRYNHTGEVLNTDILALIRTWISNGAPE